MISQKWCFLFHLRSAHNIAKKIQNAKIIWFSGPASGVQRQTSEGIWTVYWGEGSVADSPSHSESDGLQVDITVVSPVRNQLW